MVSSIRKQLPLARCWFSLCSYCCGCRRNEWTLYDDVLSTVTTFTRRALIFLLLLLLLCFLLIIVCKARMLQFRALFRTNANETCIFRRHEQQFERFPLDLSLRKRPFEMNDWIPFNHLNHKFVDQGIRNVFNGIFATIFYQSAFVLQTLLLYIISFIIIRLNKTNGRKKEERIAERKMCSKKLNIC